MSAWRRGQSRTPSTDSGELYVGLAQGMDHRASLPSDRWDGYLLALPPEYPRIAGLTAAPGIEGGLIQPYESVLARQYSRRELPDVGVLIVEGLAHRALGLR